MSHPKSCRRPRLESTPPGPCARRPGHPPLCPQWSSTTGMHHNLFAQLSLFPALPSKTGYRGIMTHHERDRLYVCSRGLRETSRVVRPSPSPGCRACPSPDTTPHARYRHPQNKALPGTTLCVYGVAFLGISHTGVRQREVVTPASLPWHHACGSVLAAVGSAAHRRTVPLLGAHGSFTHSGVVLRP